MSMLGEAVTCVTASPRDGEQHLNKLTEALSENLPLLLGGGACLVSGVVLLFDDVKDFGDLSRPHHYMWGILLLVGGAILLALAFTLVVVRLYLRG